MRISLDDISFTEPLFRRPECVLCCASGDMFTSHAGAIALHVGPEGTHEVLGYQRGFTDTEQFLPNGLAIDGQGTILAANLLGEGGIWAIGEDGHPVPKIMEADGIKLEAANFVLIDTAKRLWITCTTRTPDRAAPMNHPIADGFIVLADQHGAHVVAEGLALTNECRIDPSNRWVYVCETAAARVSRFALTSSGELGARETWVEFPAGTYPDGCAFDTEGYLWIVSVISNRVIRVAPDRSFEIVIEDVLPGHIGKVQRARDEKRFNRKHYYMPSGSKLQAITSIAFGGPDHKTVYLGSLIDNRLATFRSPIAGAPPPHWQIRPNQNYSRQQRPSLADMQPVGQNPRNN